MNLFENDYPSWVDEMFETSCRMGICNNVELEQSVWNIARQSIEIPNIGNITCGVIFNRIASGFKNKYEEDYDLSSLEVYINSIDSHIYLNGESITTYQELLDQLEYLEKD